jgi:hypothetical protein
VARSFDRGFVKTVTRGFNDVDGGYTTVGIDIEPQRNRGLQARLACFTWVNRWLEVLELRRSYRRGPRSR